MAETFLVLQMPINILPLNKHSLETVPNTPDANCETVTGHYRKPDFGERKFINEKVILYKFKPCYKIINIINKNNYDK